ncbi:MAG: adenylate/guanylate cyclase domain-containing protein [Gammaproteobacteria bacterium]
MKIKTRQNALSVFGLLALTLLFAFSDYFENVDAYSKDIMLLIRHQVFKPKVDPSSSPVVVIAVDEKTYDTEPFSSRPKVLWTPYLAKVQDLLLKSGVKVVGYDIIFSSSVEEDLPGYEKPFLISLLKGARQKKIILGKAQHSKKPVAPHPAQMFVVQGNKNVKALNLHVDPDDIIRRVPMFFESHLGNKESSMSLELASRYLGQYPVANGDGSIELDGYRIPGSENNAALINFQGYPQIPAFSLYDLYQRAVENDVEYFKSHFQNKVVLLGVVLDVEDRKLTSKRFMNQDGAGVYIDNEDVESHKVRRDTNSGVYIHAIAVNNFLQKNFLSELDGSQKVLLLLASSLLIGFIALLLKPIYSTLITLMFIGVLVVGGAWTLLKFNLFLPILPMVLTVVFSFILVLVYKYFVIDRQKSQVRDMFGLYLEPKLVDQMLESEQLPELGGEEKTVTAWFADLANFTALSEGLSPTELIALMNKYFSYVTEIIEAHGGFVAQYVGDEVYAVFGAPFTDEHNAGHATAAALAVKEKLEELNNNGTFGNAKIYARIGVNTGKAIVGNVGSSKRFNYAIMGDTVNLASRLEGANKFTSTDILISDSVAENLPDSFLLREVATIRVKGKEKPCVVYEPLYILGERQSARDFDKSVNDARHENGKENFPESFSKTAEDFALAHSYFAAKEFAKTIEVLSAYENDPAAQVIIKRAKQMIKNPPGEDWDGVVTLTDK